MTDFASDETINDSDLIASKSLAAESGSANFVMDVSALSTLRVWLLVGLILPFFGMAPLLYVQSLRLFEQQGFWYFPVSIGLGSWLLFWTCSYRPANLNRGRVAIVLLWSGLVTAAIGLYWYSPWVIQVASVVVLTAWSLGAFGGTSWTRVLTICSLFLVAVPIPSGRDIQVSDGFQSIATWCSNGLLDAISIPNIVEGDSMQIAESKFRVAVVCAGADSMFAFIAIGIAVIAIRRCPFLPGLITLLTLPLFSVLENILRLLVIAIGLVYFKVELTEGWAHFVVAVSVFLVSVISFWLTHKAIVSIFEPIDSETEKNRLIAFYQMVTRWPDRVEGPIAAGAQQTIWKPSFVSLAGPFVICLLIGAISFYSAAALSNGGALIAGLSEEMAALLPSDDAFSEQFGGLRKVSFRTITKPGITPLGKYTHLWRFDDQGNQVFVSLDFPFQGWQPIWSFYQSSGWKILEIKPVEVPASSGQTWTVEEFEMQNQYGLYGFVWFASFDENGIPVDRKNDTDPSSRKNIFERLKVKEQSETQLTYQVQVFFESGRELNEAEMERNRKLFFAIFEQVRQQSQAALMKAK